MNRKVLGSVAGPLSATGNSPLTIPVTAIKPKAPAAGALKVLLR